jgi:hypothetical protein
LQLEVLLGVPVLLAREKGIGEPERVEDYDRLERNYYRRADNRWGEIGRDYGKSNTFR